MDGIGIPIKLTDLPGPSHAEGPENVQISLFDEAQLDEFFKLYAEPALPDEQSPEPTLEFATAKKDYWPVQDRVSAQIALSETLADIPATIAEPKSQKNLHVTGTVLTEDDRVIGPEKASLTEFLEATSAAFAGHDMEVATPMRPSTTSDEPLLNIAGNSTQAKAAAPKGTNDSFPSVAAADRADSALPPMDQAANKPDMIEILTPRESPAATGGNQIGPTTKPVRAAEIPAEGATISAPSAPVSFSAPTAQSLPPYGTDIRLSNQAASSIATPILQAEELGIPDPQHRSDVAQIMGERPVHAQPNLADARTTHLLASEHHRHLRTIGEAAAKLAPNGTVEVVLDPPELGRVTLAMTGTENTMSVVISSDRTDVLEMIRRNIETLRTELMSEGYSEFEFDFRHGGQDLSNHSDTEKRPTPDDIAATATLQEATQTHAVMQLGRIDIRI